MAELDDRSAEIIKAGRLERALGHPGFQRMYARATSIAGVVFVVGVVVAWMLKPGLQLPPRPGFGLAWSTPPEVMRSLADIMSVLMLLTASLLGLYLAMRGSSRPLPRLLAASCGSLAVGIGVFPFVGVLFAMVIPSKSFRVPDGLLIFMLLMFFAFAIVALAVWMFSTIKFLLYFPKPVVLAGIDPAETAESPGEPCRKRGSWRSWISPGRFAWRWFASPQFLALATGMILIVLVNLQSHRLPGDIAMNAATYLWCWLPFAFISVKYRHVGDEDRQSIRWVMLGESIWLALFLGGLLLFLIMNATGLLAFDKLSSQDYFTGAFLAFFYYGFITVLLLTLGLSILYHGTLDPDLVMRRTWVVAVVGIVSGMLFVAIERLAANLLVGWLEISTASAFTLVGIITAVCIFPIRTWAEQFIKRTVERWQSHFLLADGVREEAVIVFADLSGYTAFSEKNEREALILAAIFHRDAESVADAHHGRLIKTIGDAVMLRFTKVDDAYAAVKQLIASYAEHAKPLVNAPLPVHAAIHRGEVVEGANGDVFGATVNLASRLLGVAGPHDVVASETAVTSLSMPAQAESLGKRAFKNVANPVNCYRLAIA